MRRNTRQPIIGITLCYDKHGLVRKGTDYAIIRKEYGHEVSSAGGHPIFLDETIEPAAAADLCDAIVISGGQDINPVFYGSDPATHLGATEPEERTEWERRLIDHCDRLDKRILGVCYGSQLLNVHYGGTLYQDIHVEHGTTMDHGSSANQAMHPIVFDEGFIGFDRGKRVTVASRHHQAVKDVAPGFSPAARADDGIIEAIHNGRHYGIQWHSESDGTAPAIYRAFIEQAQKQIHAPKYGTRWFDLRNLQAKAK